MATVCPYCNIEVSESSIEAEDGCCPECGAVIGAASSFLADDDLEFDDEERNDIYGEEDEDEDEDDIFERNELDDDIFDDEEFDEEFDDEDAYREAGKEEE